MLSMVCVQGIAEAECGRPSCREVEHRKRRQHRKRPGSLGVRCYWARARQRGVRAQLAPEWTKQSRRVGLRCDIPSTMCHLQHNVVHLTGLYWGSLYSITFDEQGSSSNTTSISNMCWHGWWHSCNRWNLWIVSCMAIAFISQIVIFPPCSYMQVQNFICRVTLNYEYHVIDMHLHLKSHRQVSNACETYLGKIE